MAVAVGRIVVLNLTALRSEGMCHCQFSEQSVPRCSIQRPDDSSMPDWPISANNGDEKCYLFSLARRIAETAQFDTSH